MPATVAVTKKTLSQKVTPTRRSVPTKTQKVEVEVEAQKVETQKVETKTTPLKVEVTSVEPENQDVESPTKVHVETKKKRQRPRVRTFSEVFEQVKADIDAAYKALKTATSALKSLESAHNKEVHNTRSRANTHRTPTTVFDQALVDYLTSRLDPSELTVTRKEPEGKVTIDLSDLDTNKPVHRPDVTQLYTKVFVKHGLRDTKDARYILYQKDPELVSLLTTGYTEPPKADIMEQLQQIRDGTFKLSIFNIQRFTSHHLHKVDLPPKNKSEQ